DLQMLRTAVAHIRQLLDLYRIGDQQQTQLARTYELAQKRLDDLIRQRDDLNAAIDDLREQMKWGEKMIASINQPKRAAE
ncbi:MAG: MerR family transcriptional regulator, partial [Paracoccaceae bacterium]|nr:MerR family transcriptional regulator [Paracoccaceae bacterium]